MTGSTLAVTFHEIMNRRESQTGRSAAEGACEVDYVDPVSVRAARAALPPEDALRSAADCFKTLGHRNRLRVLKALEGRELCVCDVAEVLGASMSGASQFLRALRVLGAVNYRTEGKLAYYTLADPFWLAIAESVLEKVAGSTAGRGQR